MFGMTSKENKELLDKYGAYGRLFRSADGQKVLADLESFCGQSRSSVCEENPNEMQTMFCEGKRRVYLRILEFMKQEQRIRKEQENGRK